MSALFYTTGAALWMIIGIGLLWVSVLVLVDGLVCARFVIRLLRYLEHGGFKLHLPLYRTAVGYWWRLFIGTTSRPDWVGPPDNTVKAFWPGKTEADVRYPA